MGTKIVIERNVYLEESSVEAIKRKWEGVLSAGKWYLSSMFYHALIFIQSCERETNGASKKLNLRSLCSFILFVI